MVARTPTATSRIGPRGRPGQVGAEYGDDQADADEDLAPVADRGLQHARHRRLAQLGDLFHRQDAVRDDRDGGEDGEDAEETEDGRAAHVFAALGVSRVDTRALDAEKDEDRDEHGAAHLVEERASVVCPAQFVGEDPGVEVEQRQHDEEHDRQELGDRDDPVDRRGALDAFADEEEEPHRPTVDNTIASTVSPSPTAGATAPMVDMISTQ
ncbi:hypothetical protein V6V89_00315 [Micromonospora sp. CPCC 206061]